MRIFAMWNGGANYAPGGMDDVETFDSLEKAIAEFDKRSFRGFGLFHYADGRVIDIGTPTVERDTPDNGGPEMYVWHYDPRNESDPYPDRLIHFGPKGGIRTERC